MYQNKDQPVKLMYDINGALLDLKQKQILQGDECN